jgi:hypothetical protein
MNADATGDDFVLTIIDVFRLTGRGTAIVGRIGSGVLKSGETVEIWDSGQLVATARATVEMITSRRADPRTIGLLLGDVDKNLLTSGQTIRRPGGSARAYLVLHDYGMGGLWWWIRASSAAEITAEFAEVEVIGDPEMIARARTWNLDDLDIEEAKHGELACFHETRQRQRLDPAFGRLFGKHRVYLRRPDPEGQETEWLTEHGPDGRTRRQVEMRADGTVLTSDLSNWPINPPVDLGDASLAACEIGQAEFERAWDRGTPDPFGPVSSA